MNEHVGPSVLHVLEPARAGVPAYVNRLGSSLAERGFSQTVLTALDQEWDFTSWAETVHRHEWKRTVGSTFAISSLLRELVADTRPEIVHAHASWAGLAARVRRLDCPLAYQPHGWGRDSVKGRAAKLFASGVEQLLAPRSDRLLLLSDAEAAAAPRARHVDRVLPVVDLSGFGPLDRDERQNLRESLDLSTTRPIALCVGEISERKRQVELVDAWNRIVGDRVELLIVGDGDGRESLREILGPATRWLGWRDDVSELMAAADYMVIASRGEGFSLVIVEALTSGLVVFSTDVGGSEIIGSVDGVVAKEIDDVVRAVLDSSPALRGDEARSSRSSRCKSQFALDGAVDELVAIYDQMTEG